MLNSKITAVAILASLLFTFGCISSEPGMTDDVSFKVDTLTSGEIVIQNTGDPLWGSDEGWETVEEMRYGSGIGEDTVLFGQILSLDVDGQGRLFVLDSYAQQIHIFDPSGALVRTVGSEGSGPGEFENATAVDVGETGEIWVMEMRKGQLTILDADGNYLRTERVNTTGWEHIPYPGGFDPIGRYNAMSLHFDDEEEDTKTMLARFDQSFTPIDTIAIPESPMKIDRFEHSDSEGGRYSMPIPFQGAFEWVFSVNGNLWTLYTGTYELVELAAGGMPLRRVTKEFEPLPVTHADREAVQRRFDWFRQQGGAIDETRIPRNKPVVENFFSDDEGNLWVMHSEPGDSGSLFDIFNAEGQFLGEVSLPFHLEIHSGVIVKDSLLFGVAEDEEGGEMVVRSRIQK
ncbi:MAG: 6-bladed beta-propeller [Rhodothermaceae bacterium]|nr:6-bladed beta-propeller [Rhodothermaceae bacterium]MYG69847.1 6-bladed beta-propeller [Rhodothermaceae bacterium]MYJ44061.1 6-bladed beta-propeller [Rhodothermaceae bacterium]